MASPEGTENSYPSWSIQFPKKHCANQTNSQWSGFNNFLLGLGGKTSKQNHNSILKEANKASPVLIWSLPSTPVSDSTTLLLLLCPPDTWPPFICYITPLPLPFHFLCHLFFCLECSSNLPLSIFKAHLKCLFCLSLPWRLWLSHMLLPHSWLVS